MTEAEWLCSADPCGMLVSLRVKPSDRKCRLYAAACCRQAWHRLSDWRCQRAVEMAELVADDRVAEDELAKARAAITIGRKVSVSILAERVLSGSGYAAAWDAGRLAGL